MSRVRLVSDFVEPYDEYFNSEGEFEFVRRSNSTPNRIDMFNLMTMIGLKTPKYGMVAQLYKDLGSTMGGVTELKKGYDKLVELVVYTDVNGRGDNKAKMSLAEARDVYPGHFAAQYIPTPPSAYYKSRSECLLVVGRRMYWSTRTSIDNWRASQGEVSHATPFGSPMIDIIGMVASIQCPLYSVEFVICGNERLAIDFTVSPAINFQEFSVSPSINLRDSQANYEWIASLIEEKIIVMNGSY